MGAFILAGLVFVGSLAAAFLVGFAEGMASAPVYTDTPLHILIGGSVLAVVIAATHWMPHIGW